MSPDPATALGHQSARIPVARGGADPIDPTQLTYPTHPDRIAGFVVVQQLGRGADSTVYQVRRDAGAELPPDLPERRHADPNTDYALKILDWSPADPAAALVGFRREAALLASVEHPRLSVVHEVGQDDGRPYLVMDLVAGLRLSDVLLPGPLTAEQVVDLGLDLIDPLAALHRRGLVHRDIKPENIMILTDGTAQLIDFGLTGYRDARDTAETRDTDVRGGGDAGHVSPVVVGTLAYAAPEQSGLLNRPVDARSDLYALGVVLFECGAGRLPFDPSDIGELLHGHASAPVPDLAALVPGTPRGLADLVALLLAKDPDDRYQSSAEVASDLHRVKTDPTIALRAVRRPLTADPPHPLIGRPDELAQLRSAWDAAQSGRGGVVLVRGPGGVGKTRLAAELARSAEAAGSVVLQGKVGSDDTIPFSALRTALEQYLAAADRLPSPARQARHEMVRAAAADHAALLLRDLTPGLAAILPTGDARAAIVADPFESDQQDQFATAVAGLLLGLARESGDLLLLLDDVQWLDPGSLRVLGELSGAVRESAVLVVATAREDARPADEGLEAGAQLSGHGIGEFTAAMDGGIDLDLTLRPLDDAVAADQAVTLLPGLAQLPRLIDLLVSRCGGNPFLVEEYVRAIVDAGLLRPAWGTWLLDEAGLDRLHLPQDVLGLVLARVDGLSLGARDLIATAAAIGTRFDAQLVARIQGVPQEVAVAALGEATGKRLLSQHLGGGFRFAHDRIREALLSGLSPAERARLQIRIAEALQEDVAARVLASAQPHSPAAVNPGAVAAARSADNRAHEPVYAVAKHYIEALTWAEQAGPDGARAVLRAQPDLPGRASAACREAGGLALANHAPAEAVWFLEQALRFQPELDPAFLHLLGQAHKQTGQLAQAQARLGEALAAETDPLARAEILFLLAEVHCSGWDPDAAIAAVEQGLAEAGARLPRGLRLAASTLARSVLAQLSMLTRIGFGSASGERRRRAEAIAALHESGACAGSLSLRPGQIMMHTLRALYWSTRIGPGRRYVQTQAAYGLLCAALGRSRSAERAFRRATTDPADRLPTVKAKTLMYQETSAYFSGQDDGQGLAAAVRTHSQWWDLATLVDSCGLLVIEACAQGRTEQAADLVRLIDRRLAGRRDVLSYAPTRVILWAVQGRAGEAGAELERVRETFAGRTATGLVMLRLTATFFALNEEGEHGAPFEAAVAEFEGLRLNLKQLIRVYRIIVFQIALGRLEQARTADAAHRPARLTAATEAVRRIASGSRLELQRAQALLTQADLQVLQGDPDDALETLSRLPSYFGVDAPILSWHSARIRARALLAAGAAAEAQRQAWHAASIARSEGWPHRVRMIAAEFGPAATAGAEFSRPRGLGAGDPGWATGPGWVAEPDGAGSPAGLIGLGRATTAGPGAPTGSAGVDRQRLEALQQVSAAAARIFDPGALARIVLDEITRILVAGRAFLFLVDEVGGELVPHLGRDARGNDITELTGYGASLVARVRDTGEPLIVTGTDEAAALGSRSAVLHQLRSILVAPLLLEGRLLGVIYLDSQIAKGIFSAADLGILTALTNHIATSLETARATQLEVTVRSARQQRDLADTLRQTLQELSETLDADEVTRRLLASAPSIVHCDQAWLVSRRDGDPDNYTLVVPDGEHGALVQHAGLADDALREFFMRTQPWVGTADDVPSGLADRLCEVTSWVVLPLGEHGGNDLVMILASGAVDTHLGDELSIAAVLAAQGVAAYDKAGLFRRVQELAVTDELTGIANRRSFFELAERQLSSARRQGRALIAVMIDIDHFKRINDVHGHPTGDDVISEVARRLALQIRTSDLLGRYGGEEFALLLQEAAGDEVIETLPERLRLCIGDGPLPTRSGPVTVTISIGVARLADSDSDLGALLGRADEALYRAKADGRDRVRLAD